MLKIRSRLLASLTLVLLLALTACNSAGTKPATPTTEPTTAPTDVPEDTPTTVPENTEVEPTAVSAAATETPTPEQEVVLNNGQILAWVAPGTSPGNQTASGELVLFDADGNMDSIMALPDGITAVTPCGPQATSRDGHLFAFMTVIGGNNKATVYLMRDSSNPETIGTDLNPIACTGSTSFSFSPDSQRFAFIDWPAEANGADSPRGKLKIYDSTNNSEVASFDNVTTFSFTPEGMAFLSFFTNSNGQADEAVVYTWDGENDSEVSTITTEEDCYYSSAAVTALSANRIALMLGNRCTGNPTQTQLHVIDTENGSIQLALTLDPGGRYFGFTATNTIFTSPERDVMWFTLPDGVSNQTTGVYASPVDVIAEENIIPELAIMPSVSDVPYDAGNATAFISNDGRYMAVVVAGRNNTAELYVVDLTNPAATPMTVSAGDPSDTIATMFFNVDNTLLYFVAGAHSGNDNSLFVLDLGTGNATRVSRGRFAQGVIAPDGTQAAIMQWIEFDAEEDPFLSLDIVTLAEADSNTIYEGGEIVDGKISDQSFAYPLSWRSE